MAALLVAVAVMTVAMTVAMPAWRLAVRREKEEELVFRGRQYVRALQLYQRKFAAAYPPDVGTLVNLKFLRKQYKDPMVEDGAFEVLYQGTPLTPTPGQGSAGGLQRSTPAQRVQGGLSLTFDSRSGAVTQGTMPGGVSGARGGVIGVRSTSTADSIRIYNGGTHYNEWLFVLLPSAGGPGGRGGPGGPRGGPGGGMGPGIGPGRGGGRGGPGGPGGPGTPFRGGRGFGQ